MAKQLFKWAKRQRLISEDPIEAAEIPFEKAAKQPCFETYQVEAMLELAASKQGWQTTHDAIAILAYTGMRVGELCQLRWSDVLLDRGEHGMIRITRGGSLDRPKDKDERTVPIFKRIRPIFDRLPRDSEMVLPDLRDRTLLARIKRLCRELGYGTSYRTHSLRHHTISWMARNGVPIQTCLQLAGHSAWSIAQTYYSLSDDAADNALQGLPIDKRPGRTR